MYEIQQSTNSFFHLVVGGAGLMTRYIYVHSHYNTCSLIAG